MSDNTSNTKKTAEELEVTLAECEKARDEYLDGWKRAKADFVNYQKDEEARAATLVKFANETVLTDLLHVLDSFDLGLATIWEDDPARKGMELIRVQLEEMMRRYGVERITVRPSEAFDPTRHEAVGEVTSGVPPGFIAEGAGAGYLLNGKMVRPARVKLSKGWTATEN